MLSLASEQPNHQEITDGKDHSPFQSVDSERPSAERVENEIDESSSHAKKRKAHSASSEALALDDASGIEFIDGYKLMTALETLLVDNTQYSEEDKEAFSTNIASIKDYIEKEVVSDESDDESEDSYSYLRTVS